MFGVIEYDKANRAEIFKSLIRGTKETFLVFLRIRLFDIACSKYHTLGSRYPSLPEAGGWSHYYPYFGNDE